MTYQRATGAPAPRPEAMELFELWFALAEVCGYLSLFRKPHQATADTAEAWDNLRRFAG